MNLNEILDQANTLYGTASEINSIREAQDAVRSVAKLIYHLALRLKEIEDEREKGPELPQA